MLTEGATHDLKTALGRTRSKAASKLAKKLASETKKMAAFNAHTTMTSSTIAKNSNPLDTKS